MTRIGTFMFFMLLIASVALGQPEGVKTYPVKNCSIKYEFSGDTEGYRELYFTEFGQRMAIYTNFTRANTFYGITTHTTENVIEFLKDGQYYHFDRENQKAYLLTPPTHMISKYVHVRNSKGQDYQEYLEEAGAFYKGDVKILDLLCEKWSYKTKDFYLWNGILIRLVSKGLKKNFVMEAVSVNFKEEPEEYNFLFPTDIPVPELSGK